MLRFKRSMLPSEIFSELSVLCDSFITSCIIKSKIDSSQGVEPTLGLDSDVFESKLDDTSSE